MKTLYAVLLLLSAVSWAQNQKGPTTLKGVLLEQLRTTHNSKDWFVDANTAVAGLTPEQASWKDSNGNHSAGQLAYHLVFWNSRTLQKLKGEAEAKFDGDNEETFDKFNAKKWTNTTRELDQVMKDWESLVESATDQQLAEWASTIAHVGTHNAYHIGQIVFVRKEQGSWDPQKGVK